MRKTASAARRAKEGVQIGTQLKARTVAKVVQLELYRAERVVSAVRRRLSELQCGRVQAELGAGRLLRELASLQRELRDCRARMIQSGVLE
jgi:hypothetical protein